MASPTDAAAFNSFIASRSYVEGYQFSDADRAAFAQVTAVPAQADFPHFFRWYVHVANLTRTAFAAPAVMPPAAPARAAAPAPAPAAAGKKGRGGRQQKQAAKVEEDDDDFDVFGDDDEEDETSAAEAKAAAQRRADAAKAKKKQKPAERSQCVFEVKPVDTETDLDALAATIRAIEINGLSWGEAYDKIPVAYGIEKLIISCVIVDELVGVDDITDPIEALEDFVQSVDLATMNR
eukprot:CAMPEP_0182454354 /NCGR_PEP_ID=MMETSP1319-20130603/1031_1 /TAXON_ID=172717 /ORGANISM="Bolidomonas pacifica, Strain RCC208" /LENGTH=235 /DNA_ID=CAMNT_0024652365 /DNA_START=25 /DNA_END=729 /DNA_ORIENTATION=-